MSLKEYERKISKIEVDSTHGAVFLTLEMLQLINNQINTKKITKKQFEKIIERTKKIHPEMASIQKSILNIELEMKKQGYSYENISKIVSNELETIKNNEIKTVKSVAQEIRKNKSVMILSSSATINQALIKYQPKIAVQDIYVLESRPLLEGRKVATRLANKGYNVKLIVDTAAGFYANKVDAILSGADSVFSDGSIINKIGTLSIALIAEHYNKPFLVGASSNKVTTIPSSNYLKLIEQKPAEEIWKKAPKNIELLNVYFEFVPAIYITKILSEKKN